MSVARPELEGSARVSSQARSRSPDYAWTYVDAVAPDGTVAMLLTRGAAEQWIRLDGRLNNDGITGTITWLPSVPRRSYTGTFVATR